MTFPGYKDYYYAKANFYNIFKIFNFIQSILKLHISAVLVITAFT